eukprot:scaffold57398_cov23-Tisochrysis_lutea.AAC.1
MHVLATLDTGDAEQDLFLSKYERLLDDIRSSKSGGHAGKEGETGCHAGCHAQAGCHEGCPHAHAGCHEHVGCHMGEGSDSG